MNNTTKFSGKAEVYAKSRPSYATAALDYISKLGAGNNTKIADIGSGTGIFSKQLLELGAEVYGVEPNEDMRLMAEHMLKNNPKFHSINANAENTTLPDNSVDFISAAQAFHWFDKEAFKKECKRILKPGGKIILIWNSEVFGSKFFEDYGAIQYKYGLNLDPKDRNKKYDPKDVFFNEAEKFFKSFEANEFENNIHLDKETLILRAQSNSAAPRPTDKGYNEYLKELEALFNKHQENGKVLYPAKTRLYTGIL